VRLDVQGTRPVELIFGWTDCTYRFCRSGREDRCGLARFTGYQIDGDLRGAAALKLA
jgi:D-arabinose 1-dehydrogenase-like Zn-dependent alcohol dehydrogenase